MAHITIIGPFAQIVTLADAPLRGALTREHLGIVMHGAVVVENGYIIDVGSWEALCRNYPNAQGEDIEEDRVLLPGFVDCHTHICWAGTRSADYEMRIEGKPYLEIAKSGGGIWSTVQPTRQASADYLKGKMLPRIQRHLQQGITTIEIKSGYGLNVASELNMLEAIHLAAAQSRADIVATCLAAHIKPKDFEGAHEDYLRYILQELLPSVKNKHLSNRVDIFIEDTAFKPIEAKNYLAKAAALGFDITVHADQFTTGGSQVAVECGALSADHLEASGHEEIRLLAASNTVAVALPGASMGMGMPFTPARKLLDAGACVAIASDWNPGSAPQGDLLMQAAVLSAYEKLNTAETFAGLTFRAAHALGLHDRGKIAPGQKAQLQAYNTADYRDILYHQGAMKPAKLWY